MKPPKLPAYNGLPDLLRWLVAGCPACEFFRNGTVKLCKEHGESR